MKPREPLCVLCNRPVDPCPERQYQVAQDVISYLCYGCSRLDPQVINARLGV